MRLPCPQPGLARVAQFYDGHHQKRLTFSKRYEDICTEWLGGLAARPYQSLIERDQLGPHLRAFVAANFSAPIPSPRGREGGDSSSASGPASYSSPTIIASIATESGATFISILMATANTWPSRSKSPTSLLKNAPGARQQEFHTCRAKLLRPQNTCCGSSRSRTSPNFSTTRSPGQKRSTSPAKRFAPP
jgi:hypothetical protein